MQNDLMQSNRFAIPLGALIRLCKCGAEVVDVQIGSLTRTLTYPARPVPICIEAALHECEYSCSAASMQQNEGDA